MCIGIYELLGNRKPRLIIPSPEVGVRRPRGDGDSSSDLVGAAQPGSSVSSRSFVAAQPSGKIDFPTRRSSNCVTTLIAAVPGKLFATEPSGLTTSLVQMPLPVASRISRAARSCAAPPLAAAAARAGGHAQGQPARSRFWSRARCTTGHEHRIVEACPGNCQGRVPEIPASPHWPLRDMKWSEIGGGLHIA